MNIPSASRVPRLAFIPLILVYVIYSIPGITRPWGNDHNGFLAKEKSGFAINYLKFGLRNTKLGQKTDEGGTLDSSQKRYSYYVRHPMGISLLTALSFTLFGVKEWASRLVPILLNVAILTLLYLFFETYWGQKIALLALFFVAFSPMLFYIRHLLAFELLALFFISAMLYLYAKWDTTGHRRYGALLFATASLGMLLSDWQVYFLAPGLVAHQLLFAKAKEKKILLLLPLAGLMFLIYMAYVIWLTGSIQGEGAGGWLWSNMLLRMNLSDTARSANITAAKWVAFFLRYYRYFYTAVLSALTALFFGLCLVKMISRKRLTEQEGLLVCYFLAITSYFMVFSHAYMCCEFMTLFFLPVSGLFGATVIFAILRVFEGMSPFWTRKTISWGLIGGSVYLFLVLGYPQAKTIYTIQNMDLPLNNFFAHQKDDIIVAFDEDSSFYQLRPYLQLRTVKRIQTLDELRHTLADRGARFCYAVLKRGAPVDQELRRFLSTTYSSRLLANSALEEYDVFDLRSASRSANKRGIAGR